MAWRLVFIVNKEGIYQIFENDGDPAPFCNESGVLSGTYSKNEFRQFSEDDGASAPFREETKPRMFARVFHYFMGKIFWRLVTIIAGGIIVAVITR